MATTRLQELAGQAGGRSGMLLGDTDIVVAVSVFRG